MSKDYSQPRGIDGAVIVPEDTNALVTNGFITLLVPGTVLALIPLALTSTGLGPRFDLGSAGWIGLLPLILGAVVISYCFIDFIRQGRGTPAPYDPPARTGGCGLYRFVRNPQYVGVILVVVGEALLVEAVTLLGYAALLGIAYYLFVRYYEEPTLSRTFGDAYSRYRKAVPRWLPKCPCFA